MLSRFQRINGEAFKIRRDRKEGFKITVKQKYQIGLARGSDSRLWRRSFPKSFWIVPGRECNLFPKRYGKNLKVLFRQATKRFTEAICALGGVAVQKILIVDDNSLFRKALRESLHSQFPSLILWEAKNGEEALQTIQSFPPELIFMDIQLPDTNGLELTQRIKGLYPDIKIVVLTSYDLPEYRDAAFHYKADHCVSKHSFIPMLRLILSEGPQDCLSYPRSLVWKKGDSYGDRRIYRLSEIEKKHSGL